MRNLNLLLIAFIGIVLSSCADKIEETYEVNEPVYMSYEDLRKSVDIVEGKDIVQPGKIYFIGNYILVNEFQDGIHIVNNSDPSNPVVEKFIEIPGNVDMAVKGNMLYADSYVDLLTFDISDLQNIIEVDRDTSVLPYILPEYENGILDVVDEQKGVVTGYKVVQKTITEDQTPNWRFFTMEDASFSTNDKVSNNAGGNQSGTGGSMARFTIVDDYLYIIDNSTLNLYDISNTANPTFSSLEYVGWNIETIFPYNQKLFIGSQSGMFVYDIKDPAKPIYISQFRHASACDPVVVEGDYAYVTLRGGNLCGAIESQLDVIDISRIEDPKLVKTYPMDEPYGLGIKNDVLFVCDGDSGLKIYLATDKLKIDSNLVAHYSDINAFDVIPLPDLLIMIGIDGLYQYDYSDLENIELLSHIPIYNNK